MTLTSRTSLDVRKSETMKADRSEPMNSTAVQSHRPDDASFADGTKAATGVQKMVICDAHTKATDN